MKFDANRKVIFREVEGRRESEQNNIYRP